MLQKFISNQAATLFLVDVVVSKCKAVGRRRGGRLQRAGGGRRQRDSRREAVGRLKEEELLRWVVCWAGNGRNYMGCWGRRAAIKPAC